MKNACIISPIHEPKFSFGKSFVESYSKLYDDDDIFLIFSSEVESAKFANICDLNYQSIIVPIDNPNAYGTITKKKFLGLKYIFDNTSFENVGVVDVDTIFTTKKDYAKLFEEYNERAKIFCNHSHSGLIKNVIKDPVRFFDDSQKEKLNSLISDNVYFWFNDIPMYHKKYFKSFWQFIENRFDQIGGNDYDFILYGYYLIANEIYNLEFFEVGSHRLECGLSLLEDQIYTDKLTFDIAFNQANPMWIKNNIDDMKNVFMKVHTDR